MDKKIILVDWIGRKRELCIPNFEKVSVIRLHEITGDEVAEVFYHDGSVITLDSDIDHNRLVDFHDCSQTLKPEDVDNFNLRSI